MTPAAPEVQVALLTARINERRRTSRTRQDHHGRRGYAAHGQPPSQTAGLPEGQGRRPLPSAPDRQAGSAQARDERKRLTFPQAQAFYLFSTRSAGFQKLKLCRFTRPFVRLRQVLEMASCSELNLAPTLAEQAQAAIQYRSKHEACSTGDQSRSSGATRSVVMETGEIARQAAGAVLVDIDGTA